MRKILLFITGLVSHSYGQNSNNYFKDLNKIIFDERNAYLSLTTTKDASNASKNFNISYYRCEWNVDPAVRYISGNVTSYYKIT
jgi:hypothetical protein